MTPLSLKELLGAFYAERLALLLRHESAARFVSDYDVNNAYQYIISREETHISWVQHALLDLGMDIPPESAAPELRAPKGPHAVRELARADASGNRDFVATWRDPVDQIGHARHRGMLGVILGEMLEHQRLFEQAAEGRTDIIGTALPFHERRGTVIDRRWIE
ncbi:MAG: hypothetical protein ACT4QD_20490 [Acidobacteriota bacterium]